MSLSCAQCGVVFSIPEKLEAQRRDDHGSFWCPNGHSNYFPGKTAEEKKIEWLERELAHQRRRWHEEDEERESWVQALRHCPICERRISLARTPEKAIERLGFHLIEEHAARPLRLAITARSSA